MRRSKLVHRCHLNEVFEFVVEFKVPPATPDLCEIDRFIIVLYASDDIVIVMKLSLEVGPLVLPNNQFERQL